MLLTDFDFVLPSELIAQEPITPRDEARLLVYNRASEKRSHQQIKDLPQLLPKNTLLVANNSRVRKARLHAQTDAGKTIEMLVLDAQGDYYQIMIGGHGVKPGMILHCLTTDNRPIPLTGIIQSKEEGPGMTTFLIKFSASASKVEELLETYGTTPLPPYITSSRSTPDQYQTVYARTLGSAAAPTAGLHFTPELIRRLQTNGFGWEEVTLHVG